MTRPITSFSGCAVLLESQSTLSSSCSGVLTSPNTPSSSSSETSTLSSTASSTNSSASSITSSDSSTNINTSLASVALRRVNTYKTSISPFLVSLIQLITSKKTPTTHVAQTHWVLQPVEKKLPRLTHYWPKVSLNPIGAKENNRRWQTHIGTPWEGRYINITTSEYEQVSQNLPSDPCKTLGTPDMLVKFQPRCAMIGGDRYRCSKDEDKSWKMYYILEKMGPMAEICGKLEPDVEVRGFSGLKYRDLLRMKYTDENKRNYQKPTEETTSDGIHIVRGFEAPSELKKAEMIQDHESLSHPSFKTTNTHCLDDDRAMKLTSDDLEVTDLHQRHQYGSPGKTKSMRVQNSPQPKQAKGVPRKSTPLETLPPGGPPPRQHATAKRRAIRQSERAEEPDATPKAGKRVRWSDEVEEKAPRPVRRRGKLGQRVDTVVHLPSRATSRQTVPATGGEE